MNPHPSIKDKIPKTWRNARKYLKQFGMTRGEQKKVFDRLGIILKSEKDEWTMEKHYD